MNKFFEYVSAKCRSLSAKKEAEIIDSQIAKLQAKKQAITGKSQVTDSAKVERTCKYTVTSNEMLVEVNRKSIVKDIRRHLESKVTKRHLIGKNEDDFQLLYNHLYHFFSLKHDVTFPHVIEKSGKQVHIDHYVKHRTNSVINDASCKAKLDNCKCEHCK